MSKQGALDALDDLVATARADDLDDLADQLEAVRHQLLDGSGDLEVAWAFVDAGRLRMARLRSYQAEGQGQRNGVKGALTAH